MTRYVALVRAANVGGTGMLPMTTLKGICVAAGFDSVSTYIASGNVLFTSRLEESQVWSVLEASLQRFAGKPVIVVVRTAEEMTSILASNPFKTVPANRTVAILLNAPPRADALERATGRRAEQLALGVREIFVAYGEHMADSKLRIPGTERGTARNMNTIAKLAALARCLPEKPGNA